MRFLIDENMSTAIAARLRDDGHDVIAVAEESPRLSDPEVLDWSVRDDRILATFDTDFGELIFQLGLPPPPAVVLFRVGNLPAPQTFEIVVTTLSNRENWEGFFWVVETAGIRRRSFPGG